MSVDWTNSRAKRLSALPPYVFARLDELKALARKEGLDLIDLGMGNPDGAAPRPVIEAAIQAFETPQFHGYPPFEGTASFREAIAKWYPGDVVLVPSPAYPAHFRGPLIAGATLYPIILKAEQDWLIDIDSIPEDVAKRAKILYFNYPSNPTAAVAPREFFEKIVAWARQYEIMLVHDLCYAELSFDGYQPTSLLEIPGAKEISVEFHTLSKTYNMAPDEYVKQVQERYRQRRDFLITGLGQLGWDIPSSKATMYLWVPCSIGMTSTDFALSVLQKTGVVVTPGNAFGEGGEGYVRVSLIADIPRLGEALQRLEDAGIRYQ